MKRKFDSIVDTMMTSEGRNFKIGKIGRYYYSIEDKYVSADGS